MASFSAVRVSGVNRFNCARRPRCFEEPCRVFPGYRSEPSRIDVRLVRRAVCPDNEVNPVAGEVGTVAGVEEVVSGDSVHGFGRGSVPAHAPPGGGSGSEGGSTQTGDGVAALEEHPQGCEVALLVAVSQVVPVNHFQLPAVPGFDVRGDGFEHLLGGLLVPVGR